MTTLLELDGVWAGYGGSDVLRDLSLTVPVGSITCVVGPNGGRKSTILRVVSGQLKPRLGRVSFWGTADRGSEPATDTRAGSCSGRTEPYALS